MKKDEVNTFFNTPIEGWSNDPCGICKYKQTLTDIKEIAEECYYECNSMNNCNISCKYYNDCNGEFSYLLAYLNKQISEVEVTE